MQTLVCTQRRAHGESLAAGGARVRTLAGVCADVCAQVGLLAERFAAHLGMIRIRKERKREYQN